MNSTTYIIHANIVMEDQMIENGFLQITNKKITAIDSMTNYVPQPSSEKIIDCQGQGFIIPGMIDIHVHGAVGHDFMDGKAESYSQIAKYLASEGVTSFLATTMSCPMAEIEQAIDALAIYKNSQPEAVAEMIGIHLEGPFINPSKKGAQPEEAILKPDAAQFNYLYEKSNQDIKLVTFAPEEDVNFDFLQTLVEKNVIASIGHSDADYEMTNRAIESGVTHATHLFNGMRGLHHRDPGVVGAVLMDERVSVEIIPDNIHFHKDLLKMVQKLKGLSRMLVITDGMRAKGMPDGIYTLGGEEVEVYNNRCVQRKSGSLAGSVLNMNDARQNVEKWLQLSMIEQTHLVSFNQATRLGLANQKGSLAVGKDADLVWLNSNGEIEKTFCLGTIAFEKEQR